MVTINLLPRKEFEITLESGEIIAGKFGTWAVKRFCDQRKYTLKQMQDVFSNQAYGIADLAEFLLAAVEYKMRREGKKFEYSEMNACEWIDELGGAEGADLMKLFGHAADDAQESGEKKSSLNGEKSSESITAPV